MRASLRWAAVVPLACALTGPARHSAAQTAESGSVWLERCSQSDIASQLACTSFIFGVNELTTLLRLHNKIELYCAPESTTVAELRELVMDFMKRNPSQLHRAFVVLILEALREHFPCGSRT